MTVPLQFDLMKYAQHQGGPLSHQGGDEEVVPHSAVPVLLEERHQKTETNVHHHLNILEH